MLRRLTVGFAGLTVAVAIAACSSNDNTTISIGPNFPSQSLYATNSTQNAVSIYAQNATSGAGPQYQIGGGNTTLNGPQYVAFDTSNDLFVTQYSASGSASLVEFKALATGNVIPLQSSTSVVHPRGIAHYSQTINSTTTDYLAVADVNPALGAPYASELLLFNSLGISFANQVIGGPATGLNVPSGVAADKNANIYVTNLQSASVVAFAALTPAPTPTTTPTTSPTATPTATPTPNPSASPTATPSVAPTATPLNQAPFLTLKGASTGLTTPTGIAVDATGNIYVSDQGGGGALPAILVFPSGLTGTVNMAPVRKISGAATLLFAPTDVKVDSNGLIYVADSTSGGAGVIYVFAANATGNVAPTKTLTSPGTVVGIGLTI